ncbi:hypothetical protein H8959_015915 [Pygathrix nigripes]
MGKVKEQAESAAGVQGEAGVHWKVRSHESPCGRQVGQGPGLRPGMWSLLQELLLGPDHPPWATPIPQRCCPAQERQPRCATQASPSTSPKQPPLGEPYVPSSPRPQPLPGASWQGSTCPPFPVRPLD